MLFHEIAEGTLNYSSNWRNHGISVLCSIKHAQISHKANLWVNQDKIIIIISRENSFVAFTLELRQNDKIAALAKCYVATPHQCGIQKMSSLRATVYTVTPLMSMLALSNFVMYQSYVFMLCLHTRNWSYSVKEVILKPYQLAGYPLSPIVGIGSRSPVTLERISTTEDGWILRGVFTLMVMSWKQFFSKRCVGIPTAHLSKWLLEVWTSLISKHYEGKSVQLI